MLENPKIAEIYGPVIQGEGPVIGRPTVFVRTGGCDFRCAWCDTDHAVLPEYRDTWQPMETEAIIDQVANLAGPGALVTFSGGNPAIQPLGPVIARLNQLGYVTAIETQGTIAPSYLMSIRHVVVSPKPPSSKQAFNARQFEDFLLACGSARTACKVVICDAEDLDWALGLWERYSDHFFDPVLYLQPMNPDFEPGKAVDRHALMNRYRTLCEIVIGRGLTDVAVLPQLHVIAWGGGPGV